MNLSSKNSPSPASVKRVKVPMRGRYFQKTFGWKLGSEWDAPGFECFLFLNSGNQFEVVIVKVAIKVVLTKVRHGG